MSLINQALKKAQNDRAAAQHSSESSPPPPIPSQLQEPKKKEINPGIIAGAVVGIFALFAAMIVVIIILVLRPVDSTNQIVESTTPAQSAQSQKPAPISEDASTTLPAPVEIAAIDPAIAKETQDLAEQLLVAREKAEAEEKARLEAEALVAEQARIRAEAEEAALARLRAEQEKAKSTHNPEIITWLSNATVSGVRMSESGNKVLINGNAYSVGDMAHYNLGLKVMIIEQRRVLFVDENGKRYAKKI